MFGKSPHLSQLESQKQLLLAESEINRTLLAGDMAELSTDICTIASRVKSLGTVASSATVLVAGLAACRRTTPENTHTKPSWVQTILQGAGLISTLWLAFRSQKSNPKDP